MWYGTGVIIVYNLLILFNVHIHIYTYIRTSTCIHIHIYAIRSIPATAIKM